MEANRCRKKAFSWHDKYPDKYDHNNRLRELKLQIENLQEEIHCLNKLILNIDHHYNDEIHELRERVEKLH